MANIIFYLGSKNSMVKNGWLECTKQSTSREVTLEASPDISLSLRCTRVNLHISNTGQLILIARLSNPIGILTV